MTPTSNYLATLKERADLLGITYSNNIGVETLLAKIEAHTAGMEDAGSAETGNNLLSIRQQAILDATKLVRIRLTCMNPAKADWPGEIFTGGNSVIGTVRKFVPYLGGTEAGYHVPQIIYNLLQEKRFLQITTVKTSRDGSKEEVRSSWAKEFAIEVLPPLTKEELRKLAINQAAAAGNSDEELSD